MSEFVRKAMMGYKEVPGGYEDPECTHVILTKQEYADQLKEVNQARREAQSTKYNANREIQEMRREAQAKIAAGEAAAAKTIADLEAALAAEQEESALQRGLNANLLRIARERANADRRLKPKKQHTGYVVIASIEKEQRYKDGNRRWRTVTLWETVIETPYVVSFEVDEIRSLIQELFTEDADGCWMIQRIGINGNCPEGYTKMIEDPEWRKVYPEHNVMLERRLKANYRTGYWEIIFLHTKPLGPVPADMKMC